MESTVDIRKVKIGDEKILAYLQTQSWRKAFDSILSKEDLEIYTDKKKSEEMYTTLLKNHVGNGFILTVEGTPHCMAYWDKSREEELTDYAELICIHSLHDNWGKGFGSMMMDRVLKEIKEAGYHKVMLWVFEKNERARKFYEKLGFTLTHRKKEFIGAVEIMYSKELS